MKLEKALVWDEKFEQVANGLAPITMLTHTEVRRFRRATAAFNEYFNKGEEARREWQDGGAQRAVGHSPPAPTKPTRPFPDVSRVQDDLTISLIVQKARIGTPVAHKKRGKIADDFDARMTAILKRLEV